MTINGRRSVITQLGLAGLLGLLLGVVGLFYPTIRGWVPNEPLFYRLTLPVMVIGTPGVLVGGIVGWVMDVGRFTSNWRWLDQVTAVVAVVGNVLIYPGVWAGLRFTPPNSRTRLAVTALVAVWCALMGAVVIFGELWGSGS